jgi:hypothetical protein
MRMNACQVSTKSDQPQTEMLADAQGEIEEGAMPPSRYLRLHQHAKLTSETKAALLLWMQGIVQARDQTRSAGR